MTKEEVLQKANEYCSEKSYTSETLTEDFKDKFSEFFSKKYSEAAADDENAIADLRFNLDTAFSATSKGITAKVKAFAAKESEYQNKIEELSKKIGKPEPSKKEPSQLPQEVLDQIEELKKFKNEEAKKAKFKDILELAKKSVRKDLHESLVAFSKGIDVSLEKEDKEQAEAIVSRFQEVFKSTIGDIKPLAPKQRAQQDDELISSVKPIEL